MSSGATQQCTHGSGRERRKAVVSADRSSLSPVENFVHGYVVEQLVHDKVVKKLVHDMLNTVRPVRGSSRSSADAAVCCVLRGTASSRMRGTLSDVKEQTCKGLCWRQCGHATAGVHATDDAEPGDRRLSRFGRRVPLGDAAPRRDRQHALLCALADLGRNHVVRVGLHRGPEAAAARRRDADPASDIVDGFRRQCITRWVIHYQIATAVLRAPDWAPLARRLKHRTQARGRRHTGRRPGPRWSPCRQG